MNPEQENQVCAEPRGISPQTCGAIPSAPNHEVNINRIENGFIVRVGCKIFCFSEWVNASEAIGLWFKNPEEAQKKYCRN